jgi:prephenate dehydratase
MPPSGSAARPTPTSKPRVAFQGVRGAFSDAAARALLGDVETVGCATFDTVAEAVRDGRTDLGLLPVENSIAGPIARTYDLLWENPGLHVIDETVHRVELALVVPAGSDESRIREVRSHPVALEQVRRFLSTRSWQVVPVADTAGSIAQIAAANDPSVAAIGPAIAAEIYGAQVLRRNIQDDADNFTRFFCIATDPSPRRSLGRACIGFELTDRPGSLRDALSAIADRSLNLRSLVSRPDRKTPFRYRFYGEIENAADFDVDLLGLDSDVRLLGRY